MVMTYCESTLEVLCYFIDSLVSVGWGLTYLLFFRVCLAGQNECKNIGLQCVEILYQGVHFYCHILVKKEKARKFFPHFFNIASEIPVAIVVSWRQMGVHLFF